MDRRAQVATIYAAAAVLALLGWREFEFLTDDAYISFRYLSNAMAGRGLVWNPAPFLPVEGYTNFGWIALLGSVWWATGIEPPAAANTISLLLGLATLAITMRLLLRIALPQAKPDTDGTVWHMPIVALALLGVVSNRTYLAWLSSGLETALFNFAVTAWVCLALERRAAPSELRTRFTAWGLGFAAALAALTRPDGWLLVAGSGLLYLQDLSERRSFEETCVDAAPLAFPLLHLLWRRSYYGEWLPNTYYAKHLDAWPESGLRYAASFAIEYAAWIWLLAFAVWLARSRSLSKRAVVVVAVLAGHFGYYTFRVGGDHFEYRVYSHLVPLLFTSFVWMMFQSRFSARTIAASLGIWILLSLPIPWMHHSLTRDLDTREATHVLLEPVAPHLPVPFRWLAEPFDQLQAWLIPHHVGMRHREHATFPLVLARTLPSREEGSAIHWDSRTVIAAGSVGYISWVLPNVAILDSLGLNDYVIARTPPPPSERRKMAHDRLAPTSYLKCFEPNGRIERRVLYIEPRKSPLTDEAIQNCEHHWRDFITRHNAALAAGLTPP